MVLGADFFFGGVAEVSIQRRSLGLFVIPKQNYRRYPSSTLRWFAGHLKIVFMLNASLLTYLLPAKLHFLFRNFANEGHAM